MFDIDQPPSGVTVTETEITDALERTHVRVSELGRQRSRRRAMWSTIGGTVAVIGIIGGIYAVTRSDGGGSNRGSTDVASAVGSDGTTAPANVEPNGVAVASDSFDRSTDGDVQVLTNSTPEPTPAKPGSAGGGELGSGLTEVRSAEIMASVVAADRKSVEVTFECVRTSADRINAVRYRLTDAGAGAGGASLEVEASMTGGYPGLDCSGAAGATISLPFDTELPEPLSVVATLVR